MIRRTITLHALFLLVLLSLVMVPGCGGCDQAQDPDAEAEAEKRKSQDKPKPPFAKPRMFVLPNQAPETVPKDDQPPEANVAIRAVKAGHWTTASQEMKANNDDFGGDLDGAIVTGQGDPIELPGVPYRMDISRPATLPKGQVRHLDLTFFVPVLENRPWLQTSLERSGTNVMTLEPELLDLMQSHEYYFVVLATAADRYKYLDRLAAVRSPATELSPYYRVVRPVVTNRVPLSPHSLTWTNTAYLLWDGISPDLLTAEQQQAIVDWLHWGGQIVVSGPVSLDLLRNSFLKDYLPAVSTESMKLTEEDLAEINNYWTIPGTDKTQPLLAVNPWAAAKLTPTPGSRVVENCGGLVVEKYAGRGRVVVTAFNLAQRELMRWPSYDSFFNAVLLRRPRRSFEVSAGEFSTPVTSWADYPGKRVDPAFSTTLHYFSRDVRAASAKTPEDASNVGPDASAVLGTPFGNAVVTAANSSVPPATPPTAQMPLTPMPAPSAPMIPQQPGAMLPPPTGAYASPQVQIDRGPGIAGWSDFGPVANAARDSLREAAGIEIPKVSFVVQVLAVYLIVLVPLNWLVFRVLGRVEWAWIAAPVISIACAMAVIRLAQLDIGFARSQREIAVVEMHSGYDRAHVTRYMALYTSLSTGYDLHFEDSNALVMPFPVDEDPQHMRNRTRSTVTYRRDQDVSLDGFGVLSNSTSMIHSEEMLPMGGALQWTETGSAAQLTNNTTYPIAGAGVVRKREDGSTDLAWIGTVEPQQVKSINLLPAVQSDDASSTWQRELQQAVAPEGIDLHILERLIALARDPATLRSGETRLVGWLDAPIPGCSVEPAAAQARSATLLVANLTPPAVAEPARDTNLAPPVKLEDLEGSAVEVEAADPNAAPTP